MNASTSQSKQPKEHRDLRLRNQHFPSAASLVFDKAEKGFVPLPIVLRKAMRYLSPPELRVLIYLQTRCSQYSICYPTLEEMAHELDLAGRRNLTPHIKGLEKKRFISTSTSGGKKFFLVHDPLVALAYLVGEGKVTKEDLFETNELLRSLHRTAISPSVKSGAAT